MASQILRVAVLDDYTAFSKPIFSTLDPSKYQVTIFEDTLRPYSHPDTPTSEKDELVNRLQDFEIICTMRERTPFPQPLLARLPNLRLLLTTGLRNASLDLPTLAARSIPVAGTADASPSASNVGTSSTVQHTVALILALARDLVPSNNAVRSGAWQAGFATTLEGKTVGIVGLGKLGALVARCLVQAFGMRVVCWSENLDEERARAREKDMGVSEGTFKVVSRDELFSTADVVSVHMVLSDRSRGFITGDDLKKMKPSAFFVNTSRGPLVKEADLLSVLEKGSIKGAAVDVFEVEPLPKDSPWRSDKWGTEGRSRVLVTPHMGYVEEETIRSWYVQQVENIKRWEAGEGLVNQL